MALATPVISSSNMKGGIELQMDNNKLYAQSTAPCFLNLIEKKSHSVVFPGEFGAGMQGGDEAVINIKLSNHSTLFWYPLANTLYFENNRSQKIEHTINISIDGSSSLFFLSQPCVLTKGANVGHRVNINVEEGASLFFLDAWMAGRIQHKEAFLWKNFFSEIKVKREETPVYTERKCLKGDCLPNSFTRKGIKIWFSGLFLGDKALEYLNQDSSRKIFAQQYFEVEISNLEEKAKCMRGFSTRPFSFNFQALLDDLEKGLE